MIQQIALFTAIALGASALTGCVKSQDASGEPRSGAKPAEIIIGAGSAMNPYWYLDENNQLTGFEKALLDTIDARLPQYTFKYQIYDFANILLSLEAGKIDVAVHQYEYNIERNQKFLYGTVGYTTFPLYIAVREDDDSIASFEDLKGKTVVSTSTTNNSYYITNKWNEEQGRLFTIIFEATTALALEDIASGRADAMVVMLRHIENYKKEYQAKIKPVGEPVSNSNAYYLFNKQTGKELQAVFDEQLQALKDDGTLRQLSETWLGGDFIAKD
ncbi:MAG: transporter substrate-binding domain-containing protein [Spirochaetaceae bacterium]|jgi:L-cystine transport system substrate-binding protein|nr:transporter substrate-binding domain-containing protein [Spirochaetaceae bacterium]